MIVELRVLVISAHWPAEIHPHEKFSMLNARECLRGYGQLRPAKNNCSMKQKVIIGSRCKLLLLFDADRNDHLQV